MRALIIKKYRQNKKSFVERRLPSDGAILVKVGDTVKGFSKIGECSYSELSKEMSFEGDFVKKQGDKVFSNEVVWVLKKGFLKIKEGKAPFSGIIESLDMDRKTFVIARPKRDYNLIAGAPGKVKGVVKGKGALIETCALEVLGVAGKGGSAFGELVVLGNYKDAGGEEIGKKYSGKILVCGFLSSYIYSKAKFFGASGFICGGVDHTLYESFLDDLAIVVTTGFGQIPMDPILFDYFKGVEARFVVLRPFIPQIVVPESKSLEWAEEIKGTYADVKDGQTVQIFSQGYYGLTGTVVGLGKGKVKVEVWEQDKVLELPPESIGIVAEK